MSIKEELIDQYYDNIILFCQDILNVDFTDRPQQVELLLNIQNKKFVCVKSAHKTGKTSGCAMAMLWLLMTHNHAKVVLLSGALLGGMKTSILPEIRLWYNNAPQDFKNLLSDTFQQTWSSGGFFARSPSINKGDGVVGTHSEQGTLMFIIDEAASARNEVFENSEGSLQGNDVYCILPSNPRYNSGFFHDICIGKDKRFEVLHFSALDNPLLDKDWAQSIEDRYGIESNAYKIKVLGQFPSQSHDCLYDYNLVSQAMGRKDLQGFNERVWALDPAGLGTDDGVLAKRRGPVVYGIESLKGAVRANEVVSWVTEQVINTPQEERPKYLIVDMVGLGSLVAFFDLEEYGVQVVELNPGWTANDNKRFFNIASELYWTFKEAVLDGMQIIYDANLLSQMSEITYAFRPNGQIQVLKSKMKHSPNELDAVAYSYFQPKQIFIS